MSSTTASSAKFQSILDAAFDSYAKQTGIELTKHPSADKLQDCNSPEDVIKLLLEREAAFQNHRDKYRQLVDCLRPVVKVVHGFSKFLGEASGLVPLPLTKGIFVSVDVLLSAANGVSASYDALTDLFECVSNFLGRLHIYTKISLSPTMSNVIVRIMVEVLSVFALATKQINQGRFKKFAKQLLGESDVEAILQRLGRLNQEEAQVTVAHTLEVVHGLFNNLKLVMEDGKASMDGIRQALVMIQQTANKINAIERKQFQKDILHWLSPPDPSTNHNIARRAHHDRTASWFTQSSMFKEWRVTGSLMWIHGKPGSGKSILSSSIIQDLERQRDTGLALMSYFYCDFRDPTKQEVSGLLASLIAQLSARSNACYNVLSALYSEYDAGLRRPDDDALMDCFVNMLKIDGQLAIYIIIDAIDECPNTPGVIPPRQRVLELMAKLVGLQLANVHICATSRPEADIQVSLTPLASHTISLHHEDGQKKDISEYVRSIVYTNWNMQRWREEDKEMVIDTLSRKADGMFRWIVCQLEVLINSFPSAIRRALDDLPKSLDETYERILLGIAEERREFARRLFQCLSVSIRPLRVEELAEVLAIQFDAGALPNYDVTWRPENSKEAVLSACSSLISIVEVDGALVVQFSHFSVKEYLTSDRLANAGERLSQYHILPHSAHAILAQASLSVLLALDDKVNKNSMKNYPFTIYAARYWVEHVQPDHISAIINGAMEHLFDPTRPHFAAWIWIYDIDHPFRDMMLTAHPTPPEATPLYYAVLCGLRVIVEHLITTCPQDVNARGGSDGTPLHAAIIKRNVDLSMLLLEHGADMTALNIWGFTPLTEASMRGRLDMIKLLLDHHADINAQDPAGLTALARASLDGELGAARVLLRHGASVETCNTDHWGPLMLASRSGHLDIVRLLLQSGGTVDHRDNIGRTPLMSASACGHSDVVRLLLQNGAIVDSCDNAGWTPLMLALRGGRMDIVHLLLESGADVELRNSMGVTPLTLASQQGYLDMVHLLLQSGATVDSCDDRCWTPLIAASCSGHVDVVRLLLQRGATVDSRHSDHSIPSSEEQNCITALHAASANGHLKVAELLIQRGANVNGRDPNNETPLCLVAGRGGLETAHLLLNSGSNVNSKDSADSTPLHKAAQNGHLDIVVLLLDWGADIKNRNRDDKTALGVALDNRRLDVAKFLIGRMGDVDPQDRIDLTSLGARLQVRDPLFDFAQPFPKSKEGEGIVTPYEGGCSLHTASEEGNIQVILSLLDSGIDVNGQDEYLQTPLHYASMSGRVEVAKLLVKYEADVNFRDKTGSTPLHAATHCGHSDIVHLLLDHGADVNITDLDGWTALHMASRAGRFETVEVLLKRGANVRARNDEGRTPLQQALRRGERDIAQLLLEYSRNEV